MSPVWCHPCADAAAVAAVDEVLVERIAGRTVPQARARVRRAVLSVDPGAYIAHQGNLQQHFQSGVTFRTFIGEGSGEAFQIRFEGEGLVYVQPSERNTIGGDV